jgi:hypothetical protein
MSGNVIATEVAVDGGEIAIKMEKAGEPEVNSSVVDDVLGVPGMEWCAEGTEIKLGDPDEFGREASCRRVSHEKDGLVRRSEVSAFEEEDEGVREHPFGGIYLVDIVSAEWLCACD